MFCVTLSRVLIAALDADLVYDVMHVSLSFGKSSINCSLENLCEDTMGTYVSPSPSNSRSYGSKVRELKFRTDGDLEPLLRHSKWLDTINREKRQY